MALIVNVSCSAGDARNSAPFDQPLPAGRRCEPTGIDAAGSEFRLTERAGSPRSAQIEAQTCVALVVMAPRGSQLNRAGSAIAAVRIDCSRPPNALMPG